nr:hypothetical protein BaRGS_026851 [Batillaria attramentaria]
MDPTIQCRHPDKYKSALACALQSLKDCVSQVGMGAALPDIDKFKQGVDVVCGKIDGDDDEDEDDGDDDIDDNDEDDDDKTDVDADDKEDDDG